MKILGGGKLGGVSQAASVRRGRVMLRKRSDGLGGQADLI